MTPREVWVVLGEKGYIMASLETQAQAEFVVSTWERGGLKGYRILRYVPAEDAGQERSKPNGKCAYCGHPVNSSTCQQNHG